MVTLQQAFDYLNGTLFGGLLPRCPVSIRTGPWEAAYGNSTAPTWIDGTYYPSAPGPIEIAINPDTFARLNDTELLGNLLHEMIHHWQEHSDRPTAKSHDRRWRQKMESLGLTPAGRGRCVGHHIVPGGPFDRAARDLLSRGGPLFRPPQPLTLSKEATVYQSPMEVRRSVGPPQFILQGQVGPDAAPASSMEGLLVSQQRAGGHVPTVPADFPKRLAKRLRKLFGKRKFVKALRKATRG